VIARILFISLIGAGLPFAAYSAEKPSGNATYITTRSFTVFGTTVCAKWVENISSDEAGSAHPERGLGRLSNRSWLAGYVSGVNRATPTSTDLLADLDLNTIVDWVDTYCKAHPKASAKEAIDAMLIRLNRTH
jgi:hypothetical protein